MNHIEELKAFQQKSDQMMAKIGVKKPELKKRNL
jgi:hypothetical protein